MQRIESAATGAGIPDTNICQDGVEFWVELKVGTRIKYRKYQPGWLIRRWKAGGLCYTLLQSGTWIRIYRGCDALLLANGQQHVKPVYEQKDPQDYSKMVDIMRKGRA